MLCRELSFDKFEFQMQTMVSL